MTQPPPDLVEHGPGDGPGPRRWRGAALLLPLAIVALIVVLERQPVETDAPAPVATASSTAPPTTAAASPAPVAPDGSLGRLPVSVTGSPVDLALSPASLYVLEDAPPSVLLLDPSTGLVQRATRAATDPAGLAVDAHAGVVWVWSSDGSGTLIRRYDADTLRPLGEAHSVAHVFAAVAFQSQLWLGTQQGLLRLSPGSTQPVHVAHLTGDVYAIAADPARDRLVTVSTSGRLQAFVAGVSRVEAVGRVSFGKPSLAVVNDHLWVGGFGNGEQELVQLDVRTLRPTGVRSPFTDQLGPGAIVTGGQGVVFVRDGGSEWLACLDPATGAIEEQWPTVQGPLVSARGRAFAIDGDTVKALRLRDACGG